MHVIYIHDLTLEQYAAIEERYAPYHNYAEWEVQAARHADQVMAAA